MSNQDEIEKLTLDDMSLEDQRELVKQALKSKSAQEKRASCELCGIPNKELRPYGPKGERICFSCGMKNEKTTERQFRRAIFGENIN